MRALMFRKTMNALAAVIVAIHFVGAAFLITSMSAAADDGSACYTIVSSDHRAFCLAKARKDPSMCYAIVDMAMRSECLSEVRK